MWCRKSSLRALCLEKEFIPKWKNGTKHFFKQSWGKSGSNISVYHSGCNRVFCQYVIRCNASLSIVIAPLSHSNSPQSNLSTTHKAICQMMNQSTGRIFSKWILSGRSRIHTYITFAVHSFIRNIHIIYLKIGCWINVHRAFAPEF